MRITIQYFLFTALAAVLLFNIKARAGSNDSLQVQNALYVTQEVFKIRNKLEQYQAVSPPPRNLDKIMDSLRKELYSLLVPYLRYTNSGNEISRNIARYPLLKSLEDDLIVSGLTEKSLVKKIEELDSRGRKGELPQDIVETYDRLTKLKASIIDEAKRYDTFLKNAAIYQAAADSQQLLLESIAKANRKIDSLNNIADSIKAMTDTAAVQLAADIRVMLEHVKKQVNADSALLKPILDKVAMPLYAAATDSLNAVKSRLQKWEEEKEKLPGELFEKLVSHIKKDRTEVNLLLTGIPVSLDGDFFDNITDLVSRESASGFANQLNITAQYDIVQRSVSMQMPSQTEMIDAMAIFLAKRVKQESVLWFFDQLKKRSDLYHDIDTLFPNSMKLLRSNEIYDAPELGKSWRYAISQDFMEMPRHITGISYLKKNVNAAELEKVSSYIDAGINLSTMLYKRYTVDEMINYLYVNRGKLKGDPGINDFITLVYALKQEYYLVRNNERYWLDPTVIMEMPDDLLVTSVSLLDMKYDHVFSRLLAKQARFTLSPDELLKMRVWLSKLMQNIKLVEEIYYQAKNSEANDDENKIKTYLWTYTDDLVAVLKTCTETGLIKNKEQAAKIRAGLDVLQQVVVIYKEADRKNYYGVVDESFNLVYVLMHNEFSQIRPPQVYSDKMKEILALKAKYETLYNKYEDDYKRFVAGKTYNIKYKEILEGMRTDSKLLVRWVDSFNATNNGFAAFKYVKLKKADSIITTIYLEQLLSKQLPLYLDSLKFERIHKLVSETAKFLNDVSTAKNSQDLSKVVEAYALPPQSYKIKAASWNTVFVNAYVGPYLGYETLNTAQLSNTTSRSGEGIVYGLSAPIGISVSKTFSKKHVAYNKRDKYYTGVKDGDLFYMKRRTVSFTFSIVDIGAVVSYRLTNTQDVLPQQFKWEQFVSPGLHIATSIPGSPLVLSTGMVYTPLIRNIRQDAGQYNALRWYGGLFFDIPIFKLHAKDRFSALDKWVYTEK